MRNVRMDSGADLLAEFSVEPTAVSADLIIESRGGSDDAPTSARNRNYNPGLELLLSRLGAQGAVLTAAGVDSRVTRKLPPGAGTLDGISLPISLSMVTDFGGLRHDLGRAAAAVGRKKLSGGNPTKRLRLSLRWPAAIGRSGDDLEALLAGPFGIVLTSSSPALRYEALGDYLRRKSGDIRLTFADIEALIGGPLPAEAGRPQFWANTWLYHWSRRRQWLEAGYRTRSDFTAHTIHFERVMGNAVPFATVELRGVAKAYRRLLDGATRPDRVRGETMSGALESRSASAYAERMADAAVLTDNSRDKAQAFGVCRVQLGRRVLFDARSGPKSPPAIITAWIDIVAPITPEDLVMADQRQI